MSDFHERRGIEMLCRNGRLVHVRETRSLVDISSDEPATSGGGAVILILLAIILWAAI